MATMITADCINCGACEPECPNNAISQGDPVYVIDPLLCTECVGFHDYEACAAVCPVDVCVTDQNNIESEEVLIARARALHPETNFGESFQSRFRKGETASFAPPPVAPAKAAPARPPHRPHPRRHSLPPHLSQSYQPWRQRRRRRSSPPNLRRLRRNRGRRKLFPMKSQENSRKFPTNSLRPAVN